MLNALIFECSSFIYMHEIVMPLLLYSTPHFYDIYNDHDSFAFQNILIFAYGINFTLYYSNQFCNATGTLDKLLFIVYLFILSSPKTRFTEACIARRAC